MVEALLGDTDRNGLPEVVTLLDPDGRHLGLFAYFGGEYRERLVTQRAHDPAAQAAWSLVRVELTEELPQARGGRRRHRAAGSCWC